MNTNWWRTIEELTQAQREFISLPATGRLILTGPPGSGKTNLLLLRAEYLAGSGLKNILVITYAKSLANFIRSGIGRKRRIAPEQIKTYHSWAIEHIYNYTGEYPKLSSNEFDDQSRTEIAALLKEANTKLPSPKIYDAIFVDEAQDLTTEELSLLLCLTDNIAICGDGRQGIYNKDGLDIATSLGLSAHPLTEHFRIGHEIAKVADKILQPANKADGLEATSNYNTERHGTANVEVFECESQEEQFERMVEKIRIQLDAYPDETIGVICASRATRNLLSEWFSKTDLLDITCIHGVEAANFLDNRIHVITAHSSKGTEFRALHIFSAEEFNTSIFRRTKLGYTAVTRAKTSLSVYKTGFTTPTLESALAKPKHIDVEDLF